MQESFILVLHVYWIFRLLQDGCLGCTRAFVKWHLCPYPLEFSLWTTAITHPHCHCTPLRPSAPPRALARLVLSSQGMAVLAWHGMVWLGVRPRCFHLAMRSNLSTQYPNLKMKTFCQIIAVPHSGSREGIGRQFRGGMFHIFAKTFILVRHVYWIFRLLRDSCLGCTRAFVKWHLCPYPLEFSLWTTAITHPHCHCTPLRPRARARSPRLVKPRHGGLGLAWCGMAWRQTSVLSQRNALKLVDTLSQN